MIPTTLEEAKQFDERLVAYIRSCGQVPIERWTLAAAFELCELRFDRAIFAALVDLKVNATLVNCDLSEAYQIWRGLDAQDHADRASLVSDDIFVQRMRIHSLLSGVAFRYRALWDKFFQLVLAFKLPPRLSRDEADKIIQESGITEGKKGLRHLLRETPMSPDNIIMIHRYLTHFDQHYRTPEAHHMGGKMLRWTLASSQIDDTPLPEFMLDAWNLWNHVESMFSLIMSKEAIELARRDRVTKEAK